MLYKQRTFICKACPHSFLFETGNPWGVVCPKCGGVADELSQVLVVINDTVEGLNARVMKLEEHHQ